MLLTISINLDNAAFRLEDHPDQLDRIAVLEALGNAAGWIGQNRDEGPIMDLNGNTVGRFAITAD